MSGDACPTCGAPRDQGCACAPTQVPTRDEVATVTSSGVKLDAATTQVSPTALALKKLARAAMPSLVGTTVGDYRVTGELGRGGQGAVYEAVHTVIGKPVALKVVQADVASTPEVVERLLGEARSMSAISHPRIATVLGFGTLDDGRPYLVMERLTGRSLDKLVRGRPLPLPRAVTALTGLAEALQAVHEAGFIHRDLKPSNVFVAAAPDGTGQLKLLDFGIAKPGRGENILASVTVPGRFVGTLEYAAPERLRGEPSGPPSDVYSMGCMAFDLFTGRPPFAGYDPLESARAHVNEPAPDFARRAPAAPPELARLVQRMLEKEPEARPTIEEVLRVLAPLPHAPLVFAPEPETEPAATLPSPKRSRVPLLVAVTLGALAGAVLMAWVLKG